MENIIINLPDNSKKVIKCKRGSNILSVLQENGIAINALCSGLGKCGKCKILILTERKNLSRLSDLEEKILTDNEIRENFRLACQMKVNSNIEIKIPFSSSNYSTQLSKFGFEPFIKYEPSIRKIFLNIEIDNYRNLKNNKNKILYELNKRNFRNVQFHSTIKDMLLPLFDISDGKLTITISDNNIIDIEKNDTTNSNYGFALDIGTTQLSLFLINLNNGETIDFLGELNNQVRFGADVISRLSYIMKKKDGLEEISKINIEQINKMLRVVSDRNNLDLKNIYKGVIVGNALMMHILHSIDPSGLGTYPYIPKIKNSIEKFASKYGIKINESGKIYTPPNISGYIGSDIVADIIASEIYTNKKNILLIDIGTNTEIILVYKEKIYGSSTPSGPAFEGGQIEFGMRAEDGAIDGVFINNENFEIKYSTIGDKPAIGICGSGIIDSISEFYKNKIIDKTGRILIKNKLITDYKGKLAINLVKPENKNRVLITQEDIREIQKAKAAIQAGYSSLLKYANCKIDELDIVIIAGSFGVNINPESGKKIGIIPSVSYEKLKYLGNLAGSGSRLLLKSDKLRKICDELSTKIEYVELGNLDYFQGIWVNALHISSD